MAQYCFIFVWELVLIYFCVLLNFLHLNYILLCIWTILFSSSWFAIGHVEVTNSDFLIPISLQHNVADLKYFKLWILLDQLIYIRNNKGLHLRVAKIYRLKNSSLWQRLNFFSSLHYFSQKILPVQCPCQYIFLGTENKFFLQKKLLNFLPWCFMFWKEKTEMQCKLKIYVWNVNFS